jgi:hypothetical protein
MTWITTFVVGTIVGLVVGRWWALVAALVVFVLIGTQSGVDEVSPWGLALMYAGFIAAGVAVGVTVRAAVTCAGHARRNTPG